MAHPLKPRPLGLAWLQIGAAVAGASPSAAIGCAAPGSSWGQAFRLVPAAWPTAPAAEHPAWTLARRLPPEAVPVVSVRHAVVASGRARSFTWEESLHDKGQGLGLGAATHLIAPASLEEITGWALAMEGAAVVDQADGYVTIAWTPGATDRAGRRREDRWPPVPDGPPPGPP